MEQAKWWMWSKRKHELSNKHDDSWEEQAFAEDAAAAGSLGGCIWPPRSYSCSFCRREFRSAQALGGHMNVHRRDRARLKQSPPIEVVPPPLHHHHHHHHPLGFQYPSDQICTLVYNPNPNSDHATIRSPLSNCDENTFFPPSISSPIVKEEVNKRHSSRSSPPSDPMSQEDHKDSRCRPKTDLSVSLNLVVRRTHPTISDENISCKRRRIGNSVDRHHVQSSEVFEISPCSIEELDLELRLGYRPKGN